MSLSKLAAPSLQEVAALVKKHPEIVTMPLGAALGAGLQYLDNRVGESGLSRGQEKAKEQLRDALRSKGSDFKSQVNLTKAKTRREIADIMARHPLRGAMYAAGAGASTANLLTLLGKNLLKLAE
jgi:hypothetical protein